MILSLTEQYESESGQWQFKATMDRSYTRAFLATSDGKDDVASICIQIAATIYTDPATGLTAPLALGSPHPSDADSLVQTIKPNRFQDPYHWKIEVSYSNQIDPSWLQTNPLQRPPIYKKTFRKDKRVNQQIWQDARSPSGNYLPILTDALNSAGEPFDPPPDTPWNVGQLTVTVNLSLDAANVFLMDTYFNAVNTDFWTPLGTGITFPPAVCLVAGEDCAEQLYEDRIPYVTMTWTIEMNWENLPSDYANPIAMATYLAKDWSRFNGVPQPVTDQPPGGWRALKVLDAGYRERVIFARLFIYPHDNVPAGWRWTPIRPGDRFYRRALAAINGRGFFFDDENGFGGLQIFVEYRTELIRVNGAPVSSPYPLDGRGNRLPQGAKPVYASYNPYGDRCLPFTGVLPSQAVPQLGGGDT